MFPFTCSKSVLHPSQVEKCSHWFWLALYTSIRKMFIDGILFHFFLYTNNVILSVFCIFMWLDIFPEIMSLKFIHVDVYSDRLLIFQCCIAFCYVDQLRFLVHLLVDSTLLCFSLAPPFLLWWALPHCLSGLNTEKINKYILIY